MYLAYFNTKEYFDKKNTISFKSTKKQNSKSIVYKFILGIVADLTKHGGLYQTQQELANTLGVEKISVNRNIKKLVSDNMIKKTENNSGKKAYYLTEEVKESVISRVEYNKNHTEEKKPPMWIKIPNEIKNKLFNLYDMLIITNFYNWNNKQNKQTSANYDIGYLSINKLAKNNDISTTVIYTRIEYLVEQNMLIKDGPNKYRINIESFSTKTQEIDQEHNDTEEYDNGYNPNFMKLLLKGD